MGTFGAKGRALRSGTDEGQYVNENEKDFRSIQSPQQSGLPRPRSSGL